MSAEVFDGDDPNAVLLRADEFFATHPTTETTLVADQSQPVRCNGSLWRLRHERNLSQRDLAELAGVSQKTIVDIEIGKNHPHPSTLRKLAKALKVEPETFVAKIRGVLQTGCGGDPSERPNSLRPFVFAVVDLRACRAAP